MDNMDKEAQGHESQPVARHRRRCNLRAKWAGCSGIALVVFVSAIFVLWVYMLPMSSRVRNGLHARDATAALQQPIERAARRPTRCRNCRVDKALVVANHDAEDGDWLQHVPDDWAVYTYSLPDREPLAYLRFIADHYLLLPDYTVFVPATAEHLGESVTWKLRALNFTALDHRGFISLDCEGGSVPTADVRLRGESPSQLPRNDMPALWWEHMMQPFGFGPYPGGIDQQGSSQFAVTRSALLTRSVDFYRAYFAPLDMSLHAGKETLGDAWSPCATRTLYNIMWHIVFGLEPLDHPSQHACRTNFLPDALVCDHYSSRTEREGADWFSSKCRDSSHSGSKPEALQLARSQVPLQIKGPAAIAAD